MLGAVKGDTEDNVSLFRMLSRRWRPLVPVKRERPALSSALGVEEESVKRKPAWIGAERPRYSPAAATKAIPKRPKPGWNPWLWVK